MKHLIITLCGSMKHWEILLQEGTRLSDAGNIVLLPFKDADFEHLSGEKLIKRKEMHEEVHRQRIDLSDKVFIVNKNQYIGKSTEDEIYYTFLSGKEIEFLEHPSMDVINRVIMKLQFFARVRAVTSMFSSYMEKLLKTLYMAQYLDTIGMYDQIGTSIQVNEMQTRLDLLFQNVQKCFNIKFKDVDLMFDSSLKRIFDIMDYNINQSIIQMTNGLPAEPEFTIEGNIPWTMSELLYSTPSELLMKLWNKPVNE